MPDETENHTDTPETLPEPAPVEPVEVPPDPVSPAVSPEPAVTIEDQGIAANEPYPTGNPRDPEADFEAAHGFRRAPKEDTP